MNRIETYKDLIVWQKAIDLSVEVYRITANFPKEEVYGLTSQVRRASNSVSLNIAEGFGRNSTKSYIQFLRIAKASLDELESGMILAARLEFVQEKNLNALNDLITQEMKMLVSMIKSLEGNLKNRIIKNLKKATAIIGFSTIAYCLFTF